MLTHFKDLCNKSELTRDDEIIRLCLFFTLITTSLGYVSSVTNSFFRKEKSIKDKKSCK